MSNREIEHRQTQLASDAAETGRRIRRYSLDPRLRVTAGAPVPGGGERQDVPPSPWARIREMTDQAWTEWLALRDALVDLPASPAAGALAAAEKRWLQLDRSVDLIQRELIGERSAVAGARTVAWMAAALVALVALYLLTHGIRGPGTTQFEPWPEWGPLKYGEVAFWSSFGVLCSLLFLASQYLARRDFDEAYQLWYVSTALRAPFLTVILMVVVLEFVEWFGEGGWIEQYILEEGNKFYFIAFMSFCLGLASDRTSGIIRDLSGGVGAFVEKAVGRVAQRMGTAISDVDLTQK